MDRILNVNPRLAMFTALQLTQEIINSPSQHLLRVFLGPDYSKPVLINSDGRSLVFRFHFFTHTAYLDQVIVRNRKTEEITILDADEFRRLYYEYPSK